MRNDSKKIQQYEDTLAMMATKLQHMAWIIDQVLNNDDDNNESDQDLDPSPVDPEKMSRLKQMLDGLKPAATAAATAANNQEQISPDLINIDFNNPLK